MMNLMKKSIKNNPLAYKIIRQIAMAWEAIGFTNSSNYWDRRYKFGGISGPGSYGRLAEFKAEVINRFIYEHHITSLIEFGCGDGNQLKLLNVERYTGVDISPIVIEKCRKEFYFDDTRHFFTMDSITTHNADLALSLDVIYHLVEDGVFNHYMTTLFDASNRFVIIYSINRVEKAFNSVHVKTRRFSDWINNNAQNFELIDIIKNKYPYDAQSPTETSFCDFYIYEKRG
jgi:hypothetical protein